MKTTTLSEKNQIVVPKEVRQRLRLKKGARLVVYPIDDQQAILAKQPIDHLKAMRGLGADVWKSLGGADKYIKEERASWGDR